MLFQITKASSGNDKPCDGAYQEEGGNTWYINIYSLQELMKLVKQERIIVSDIPTPPRITFYDDYIE